MSMATNVDNLSIQNCELEKMQNQLSELLGQMKKLTNRMNRLKETNPFNSKNNFNRNQEAEKTFNNNAKDCISNRVVIRITSNRIIIK